MLYLKVARIKSNYSQETLANKIGVTRETICSWETGKTSPNVPQLKKLSEILNCTVNDLIEE